MLRVACVIGVAGVAAAILQLRRRTSEATTTKLPPPVAAALAQLQRALDQLEPVLRKHPAVAAIAQIKGQLEPRKVAMLSLLEAVSEAARVKAYEPTLAAIKAYEPALLDAQQQAMAHTAAAVEALQAWQASLAEKAAAAKYSVAAAKNVAAERFEAERTFVARRLSLSVQGVPRQRLSSSLSISRMVTGLWQVADLERAGGAGLDEAQAMRDLELHRDAGLSTFDMADHYGSAELLAGKVATGSARGEVQCLTKWVPKPGRKHAYKEAVDEAVQTALSRLGTEAIDLMQLHTWDYCDGAWLDQVRSPMVSHGLPYSPIVFHDLS